MTLVAEVIETKTKPSQPWGEIGESAFGVATATVDRGPVVQSILALGHQDTDPQGLQGESGIEVLGASGDHLVVTSSRRRLVVGEEVRFQPNYSALVRSMGSPFVEKVMRGQAGLVGLDGGLQASAS